MAESRSPLQLRTIFLEPDRADIQIVRNCQSLLLRGKAALSPKSPVAIRCRASFVPQSGPSTAERANTTMALGEVIRCCGTDDAASGSIKRTERTIPGTYAICSARDFERSFGLKPQQENCESLAGSRQRICIFNPTLCLRSKTNYTAKLRSNAGINWRLIRCSFAARRRAQICRLHGWCDEHSSKGNS